jgi:hypothetical protein
MVPCQSMYEKMTCQRQCAGCLSRTGKLTTAHAMALAVSDLASWTPRCLAQRSRQQRQQSAPFCFAVNAEGLLLAADPCDVPLRLAGCCGSHQHSCQSGSFVRCMRRCLRRHLNLLFRSCHALSLQHLPAADCSLDLLGVSGCRDGRLVELHCHCICQSPCRVSDSHVTPASQHCRTLLQLQQMCCLH